MSSDDINHCNFDDSANTVATGGQNLDNYMKIIAQHSNPAVPQVNVVGDRNLVVYGNYVQANAQDIYTNVLQNTELQPIQEILTSELSEDTIVEELQRHPPCPDKLTKALRQLADLTEDYDTSRFDLVKIVLDVINRCPRELNIQRASLHCLSHLKSHLSYEEFGIQLCVILTGTLLAVENFPLDKKLYESALDLMNHRELRRCFRHESDLCVKCCRKLMDGLDFPGEDIQENTLMLFVYLLEFIPMNEIEEIGHNNIYRDKLFMIIKKKHDENECDYVLRMTLDICSHLAHFLVVQYAILQDAWLSLLQSILAKFSNTTVKRRVLCIIEYSSRLDDARGDINRPRFVEQLLNLVDSDDIRVSFLSAVILLRVITSTHNEILIQKILSSLQNAIERWELPEEELIKCDSLIPICNLLQESEFEEIQLLAAWTLNHLCSSTNSKCYIKLLYQENLLEILHNLSKLPSTTAKIPTLIDNILKTVGVSVNITSTSCKQLSDIMNVLRILEDQSTPKEMVKDVLKSMLQFLQNQDIVPSKAIANVVSSLADKYSTYDDIAKILLSCHFALISHLEVPNADTELRGIMRYSLLFMKNFSDDEEMQCAVFDVIVEAVARKFIGFDLPNCVIHALDIMFTFDQDFNEKCLHVIAVLTTNMNSSVMDAVGGDVSHRHKLYGIIKETCATNTIQNLDIFVVLLNLSRGQLIKHYFEEELVTFLLIHVINQFETNLDATKLILEILVNIFVRKTVISEDLNFLKKLLQSQNFTVSFRALSLAVTVLNTKWLVNKDLKNDLDKELPSVLLRWKRKPARDVPILMPTWYLCNHSLQSCRPHCQYYAIWVLHSALLVNREKYSDIINESGDDVELKILMENPCANWCQNEEYSPTALALLLRDEILLLLNVTWEIVNLNRFVHVRDLQAIITELKEEHLDPIAIQTYIRFLRLVAETLGKIDVDSKLVLDIFLHRVIDFGIQRECLAFFATVAKDDSKFLTDGNKTEITKVFCCHKLLTSSVRYALEFATTLKFTCFRECELVIYFLMDNLLKFRSGDWENCYMVAKTLSLSALEINFKDQTENAVEVNSLVQLLKTTDVNNKKWLVMFCFRLLRSFNDLAISCNYPAEIYDIITKNIRKFDDDHDVKCEGLSLLSLIRKDIPSSVTPSRPNIELGHPQNDDRQLTRFQRFLKSWEPIQIPIPQNLHDSNSDSDSDSKF